MTDLRNQRRLAAALLGCGESRVWIDPLRGDEVAEAVTRRDVATLVGKGLIKAHQRTGVSRARANKTLAQKRKGRRRGPGSRKGAKGSQARDPRKKRWIRTIRALRDVLTDLRETKKIDAKTYRAYYLKAKGGAFNSRKNLQFHLRSAGHLKEESH